MTSSKTIKLGWLFPYSGVFINLRDDLMQGFQAACHKEGVDFDFDHRAEFIQTGSQQDVEKALKKLILFDRVDCLIGVISSKVAINILPLLETNRVPLLMMNLGADIPISTLSSPWLLYNSLHLWKSEWAIGKWSQQRWGGEPSINIAIYESGYGLTEAYKTGCGASGATSIKMNIVKNYSPSPDISPLIQYLGDQKPKHAHVLLSGKEGDLFIKMFYQKGLQSHTALTVNPFMVEDGILVRIPEGLELYNAMTWSATLDNGCNVAMKSLFDRLFGSVPNVFGLLAYEAGLALVGAIAAAGSSGAGSSGAGLRGTADGMSGRLTRENLALALAEVRPRGPRGRISLSTLSLSSDMSVFVRRPELSLESGMPENKILETLDSIEWNGPSLPAENIYSSGWQNPYLCV
jgi:ABC-type branched-subunit amino acid transport system substrate-binding protein